MKTERSPSTIDVPVSVDGVRRGAEVIEARPLGGARYALEFTPGIADGLAAGDVIELCEEGLGYRLMSRGGNFGVWLWSGGRVGSEHPLVVKAHELAASLQGRVDGGTSRSIVLTLPATTGFARIVSSIDAWIRLHPGFVWEFTNAYSADGHPLDWWSGNR